ncbi:MAG: trypsin-like peptidase domain-containing protein [Thermoguttaceae bacterium]
MLSLPAALVAMAITGGGAGETVLLDFYADWCGPCRSMNPTVEQLAANGYPVRRVNVDQYRDLAQRFGIKSIPCFVMIVNGQEAGRVVGPTSIGRLEQLCSLGRTVSPSPNSMLAMPAPTAPAYRGAMAGNGRPNVPVVPVVYAAPPKQQPATDAAMLAASVRLRVEDPQGHNCGSGTIIDARAGGEALVLTCGHLFRDSNGTGKIEVDVYGPAPAVSVPGRLVAYDLERDIGLIAFRPQGPVMVARVAPPGYAIRVGDAVTSVGCNEGDDPSVQHSRVNSLDRFLDPSEQRGGNAAGRPHAPWNLQVAGQPIRGRSGGGLFSTDGMVIGVCNAAEPVDCEGLFAALGSIHAALDQQGISSLYKQPVAPPAMVPPVDSPQSALVAVDPFSAGQMATPRVRIPRQDPPAGPPAAIAGTTGDAAPRASATESDTMANGEQAVMEKIRRRVGAGAEVVCIIRDHNNPQSTNEVITLDRASPAFVNQLTRAGQPQIAPHETSLEVPKRRTPILEWDAETGWRHQHPLP